MRSIATRFGQRPLALLMLATLADNGGRGLTLAPLHESQAIDSVGGCGMTVDQRYVPRDAKCDVGAADFTDFTTVTITIYANAAIDPSNGSAVVTGTVKCSRAGDQFGVLVGLKQQKGKTSAPVEGTGGGGVTCTTSTQAWSATVIPSSGAFDAGNGTASARTNDTMNWVTPATVSKAITLRR